MTHEEYVTLETARMLRRAGFDWDVCSFYQEGMTASGRELDGTVLHAEAVITARDWNAHRNPYDAREYYSAPTLAVAHRWLWQVKHLLAEPVLDAYMDNRKREHFACRIWSSPQFSPYTMRDDENGGILFFKTYEAALDAGLQACLKMILRVKNNPR